MGKASSSSAVTTRRASSSSASPTVAASAKSSAAVTTPQGDMKRKKKKGRPSLLDLQIRQQQLQKANSTPNSNKTLASTPASKVRRSTRRNPLNSDYEDDDDDDDDDEDEREQKKVKLVVRLPQSSQPRDSVSRNSSASASSGEDSDGRENGINAAGRRSTDAGPDQEEKVVKAMATVRGGSSLGSGPTTPLPDKALLVFVLDRLQKKDTYGVFSEPVDPNELPDYHELIQNPMDFGTVRKKLNGGAYTKLEELEADVMLICANAMQYNSADTVYYRQARTIQDLAMRDFGNLRNHGDNGEPAPKVVRRGRPPSNKSAIKKPVTETSPAADRVGIEASPGSATLASGEDRPSGGSNGYNLRKAPPMFYKFRSNDGTPLRSRNGENYSDWLVDWNSEFPASILRADMKYGKKHFADVDEGRRDTYKQFHPSATSSQQSYFSNSFEDSKRLIAVGLHVDPHAYARSVARYAANLGPAVWAVACKKLKNALPDGLPFGPGWVEENDTPLPFSPEKSSLTNGSFPTANNNTGAPDMRSVQPRPPGDMSEAGRRVLCKNEFPAPVPHKSTFQVPRNGFNGMFGFDQQSQTAGMSRLAGQHGIPYQNSNSEETKLPENWNFLKQQVSNAVQQQPDLNVRAQTSGSPSSSSLPIGSPPPDLALQL